LEIIHKTINKKLKIPIIKKLSSILKSSKPTISQEFFWRLKPGSKKNQTTFKQKAQKKIKNDFVLFFISGLLFKIKE